MAQQGKKKRPSSGSSPARPDGAKPESAAQPGGAAQPRGSAKPSGAKPSRAKPPAQRPPRTAVGHGPQGSAIRRQSVASNRPTSSNNAQKYILGAAVLVILAVVIVGYIWNKSSQTPENDGYGISKNSLASIGASGAISVAFNDPPVNIDIYEDPICPYCGAFERQYGQQIAQAVDQGKVKVTYHMLNFLDRNSSSGNYSTRASAALMCTASNLGSTPGAWSSLHTTLYSEDVQPTESGSSDLTNDQLNTYLATAATAAGLAGDAAAVTAAQTCVTSGQMLPTVAKSFAESSTTLTTLVGGVQSPVIVSGGKLVNVDEAGWLAALTG